MDDLETLAEHIREHTAARGVDLWAVETHGLSAAEWAEMTDRDRSTVARNVRRARGEEETQDSQDTPPDWEIDAISDVAGWWGISMEEAELFLEDAGFYDRDWGHS